jgi:hypothetical protein
MRAWYAEGKPLGKDLTDAAAPGFDSVERSVHVLQWRDYEVIGQLHAGRVDRAVAAGVASAYCSLTAI